MRYLGFVLIAACLSNSIHADERCALPQTQGEFQRCMRGQDPDPCTNPSNRAQEAECGQLQSYALSVRVKEAYEKALKLLSGLAPKHSSFLEARDLLIDAQKSWEIYTRNDCAIRSIFSQSESSDSEALECFRQHVERRISELKAYGAQYAP